MQNRFNGPNFQGKSSLRPCLLKYQGKTDLMHYWIVNLFDFSTELSALSCRLTFQTSQVVKIKGLFVVLSVTADKTLGLRVNGDVDGRIITVH